MKEKISVGIWAFQVTVDRVCTDGYKDPVSPEKAFEMASKVDGITGVELHYPTEFPGGDVDRTREILDMYGLKCSNVMVDYYKREWRNGGIASYDDRTWRKAIDIAKEAMDAAVELGANQMGLCPTHDGYDYHFQSDLKESYDRVIRALKEIAQHNTKVRVGVEYKPRETRAYIVTRSADRTLLMINEVGANNLGVIIDVGHSLFGQENPAESAYISARYGKLYHLHLNDNHGIWDDDLTFGSVHFWELLEFLTWLRIVKYDGWFSFDIYPYREDPVRACEENVENLKLMMKLVERIDLDSLKDKMHKFHTLDIIKQLRESIFKK